MDIAVLRVILVSALLSGCAGNYIELEHVSNVYCGPPPSFNDGCPESDFNSIGLGYRKRFENGTYLDAKVFDRVPFMSYDLEGHGPHVSFKAGYEVQ